jgi:C1A family cysteine protease
MKIVAALILLSLVFVAIAGSCSKDEFEAFKDKFARTYYDQAEEARRYENFCNTIEKNERLREQYPTAEWGITQFADWTEEEFESILTFRRDDTAEATNTTAQTINSGSPPATYSWLNWSPSVVTGVYNQGQCGSCWAFSATEQIESMWALAGHTLVGLSMQQITSCDPYDDGCGGGNPYNAYKYVMSVGGLDSYSSYPYEDSLGQNLPCKFNKANIVASISGWNWVSQSASTESQMVNKLYANGPISVCVDASNWSSYTGGIYPSSSCGKAIDHCVEAIGYNTGSSPYWLIRNSWGTSWGQNGYMYLQYGVDACGVAQQATQVTI